MCTSLYIETEFRSDGTIPTLIFYQRRSQRVARVAKATPIPSKKTL